MTCRPPPLPTPAGGSTWLRGFRVEGSDQGNSGVVPPNCSPLAVARGADSFFAVTRICLEIWLKAPPPGSQASLFIPPVLQRPLLSEPIATGQRGKSGRKDL